MTSALENMKSMRDINDYCVANSIDTLAQGMIELAPPLKLRQLAGEVALKETAHCYRARAGEPDFINAVVKVLEREGVPGNLEGAVLATHGVTGGIVAALLHFKKVLGRVPKVVLMEPFYTYHLQQILAVTGVQPLYVEGLEGDHKGVKFNPNFAGLEAAMEEGDVILICTPQNPTGKVWDEAEVKRVTELVKVHKKKLIVDECYADMVFGGRKHVSPIQFGLDEDVVVCRGFSKTLGAQSWRVGYAVSHKATVASMMAVMDPIYICTPLLQHAVADFLNFHYDQHTSHITELNQLLADNWATLSAAFVARFPTWTPIAPQGTMYGNFIHTFPSDLDATKAALEAGVGICPGSMFTRQGITPTANTNTVRIHCGVSREKAERIAKKLREGI
eukprot:TRINITY_DN10677_c0_g1_i1.p1 TRINITY_DN10677_c0_g1~~TRINITY_DN10677_c0_g1_i1.p1  ORF type:complete len:391 (+),score=113.56 TRINITY_DN10677_c0_g1_i1:52-1224(+)